MVGPIYGEDVGLDTNQIAYFLSAFVLGGALAQYPVGWLADKYDRRLVLIWLSIAAIVSTIITISSTGLGTPGIMISAGIFGLTTFPIYSVAAAHAHDFASDDERVELSAALMFYFALGAIAAPYLAALLIDDYGPHSLFIMIAIAHGILVVFGFARMRARPAPSDRTRYTYAPRTSFLVGRLTRRSRQRAAGASKGPTDN
jgi:MFS family permease